VEYARLRNQQLKGKFETQIFMYVMSTGDKTNCKKLTSESLAGLGKIYKLNDNGYLFSKLFYQIVNTGFIFKQ
jgi:hypothetical protein